MATLEDKILGEKLHNYCSSSEESENEDSGNDEPVKHKLPTETPKPPSEVNKWEGSSTNTGPKGVIEDWRKFKQLENEKRQEDERERVELAKKLTMTVRTALEEEKEKAALEDPELAELLNDDFLLDYQKRRMQEMMEQTNLSKKFGDLKLLKSSREFLDAVDKEDKTVTVIVHIYEECKQACRIMNQCLQQLAKIYDMVKFCAISATLAGVSKEFKIDGVPALLVYKAGNVIGNFVKLSNYLGSNFEIEDVQGFLIEHGLLEDKNLKPSLIKTSTASNDVDSD